MSAALIQGGYKAINYKEKYEEQVRLNEELRSDLYDLRSGVTDFLDSFKNLKDCL